jgi:CelD/BcsL family acetyltransferase involved in cellulose biosynthesis
VSERLGTTRLQRRVERAGLHLATDLSGLEAAWNRLAALNLTPMQSFNWAASTETTYGQQQPFVGLLVGDPDAPVAIAPFRRQATWPTELMLFAHNEPTDLLYEDEAALTVLCEGLVRLRVPLKLFPVFADRPSVARFGKAMSGRGLLVRRTGSAPVVRLDETWTEPERRFNAGRRSDLRRARRRADALGAVRCDVLAPAPDDVDPLLDEVIRVEGAGWKVRAGTALLARPQFAQFLRHWARTAAADGALRLAFLRLDEVAVAVQVCAVTDQRLWLLKMGYDEAFGRCSPGNLLMLEVVRWAARSGLSSVEFLGGREPWTDLWATGSREYCSMAAFPIGSASLPVLARDVLREARTVAGQRLRGS